MDTTNNATLFQRIASVMTAVRSLPKDGFNKQGNYNYVSSETALEHIGRAMADNGLVVVPILVGYSSETQEKRTRTVCEFDMHICDADGNAFAARWMGEGIDYGSPDKALNKAMTNATKYFLMKLFVVGAGGEDPDSETTDYAANGRTTAAKTPPPPAAKNLHKPTPTQPDAQALDENKAVEWAMGVSRFATADEALEALRSEQAKYPADTVDAFKVHWRDYVISLPLLQAAPGGHPPAEEPDATPAEDDPFDKPPAWRTPKEAQEWAVLNGHCTNEHEARNSWANTVKEAGGLTKANAADVAEAFYRKHMGRALQPA